jgi:predicted transcriptional regulator of viral defense system
MALQQPNWTTLYETAAGQEGHFTTGQAAETGYSAPLVAYHLRMGRFVRVLRGVYRLAQFPVGEHEDLVALWLWTARQGVFGFETALALHELSDALPSRVHLVLPESWRARRVRFPVNTACVYADVGDADRTWVGCLPVTTPARAVRDCAAAHVAPDLVRQAVSEGLRRGLFARAEVESALRYVDTFGGGKP